jgi:hypothetical protein
MILEAESVMSLDVDTSRLREVIVHNWGAAGA